MSRSASQKRGAADWRNESFRDALRNVRYLKQLVKQMEKGSAQDRDFQIAQRIVEARQNPGLRMLRLVPRE